MTDEDAPRIRRATAADAADAAAAADVYLRARRAAVPGIPRLVHDDEDVRRHIARLVDERETWLAEVAAREDVVGLMVLDGDWIDQLYVDPPWTGRGIGSRLVTLAKERRANGLQLWTFESNRGAQRFYERHGFVAVEQTDGTANEEGAPDIRYVWRP